MSYAFRIKLDKISDQVNQKGEWRAALMDFLPQAEMESLLTEALRQQGWSEDDQGIFLEVDGIRCDLIQEGSRVVAHLDDQITIEHTVVGDSDDSRQLRQARIDEGHREQKQALRRATEHTKREQSARLLSIEPTIMKALERASHRAHAQGLERKANRLGEVISSKESSSEDGELEITIHVKLT